VKNYSDFILTRKKREEKEKEKLTEREKKR